ncbi:MAG: glycerol kinase [Halobacteriovoraceae bacterium]|nr:glycerol kinase [Halobacteriovoraceae bacterium]|tara:strand:- start:4732 stop:6210 length:1479 start_codon:yes stop_codon:yes gene_type:complete
MKSFILSLDQGTTGTTSLLIDSQSLEVVDKVNQEFKQIYPKPGWVEHNLNDIWKTVQSTVAAILERNNINGSQIISIGITNQRETTCAYKTDGQPLTNAIVWQDRRTSEFCKEASSDYQSLQKKTGLPLDPYFSGTKMRWLLENNDAVYEASQANDLKLSTIDTFLLYKMTNCKTFKTEPSNASRTLLMNLESCSWDKELLEFFGVKEELLPDIVDSFTNFGETQGLDFLPDGIPISCILGDQQAALFGQAGYKSGDLKCTYGTGAFILLNTGEEMVYSKNGLLTTVAYQYQGKPYYALEGSCYIAGAAVQWLRDNLNIIESSPDVETLAANVKDLGQMEHLIFLPFFTGIGSPYWKAEAKGAIIGLTRDSGKAELARACLDGIALSVQDSIAAIEADSPKPVTEVKVDGGACQNDLLMHIQASFSQKEIQRPKTVETTAYGVALGSLIGIQMNKMSDLDKLWKLDKSFNPSDDEYYPRKSKQWGETIKKLF